MSRGASSCVVTVHETAPYREGLTIEIDADFSPAFVEGIKRIPWQERGYDETQTRWYAAPRHRDYVLGLARAYHRALLIEGDLHTDLHTGRQHRQLSLF